jgi:glycine/D-amino acid oxidase-like deaminating enzyme
MKVNADFVIIGAGIVGLTVAYELTEKFRMLKCSTYGL